jgi:surface antigen
VNGNQFTVSEMNFSGWNVVDRRTITLGGRVPIMGFIYG